MTEKLYEQDSLARECKAVVTSCVFDGEKYNIVLDRTVLFPEGGGQLSDTGRIEGGGKIVHVLHGTEKAGTISYCCDALLAPGTEVTVYVDWQRRLDYMQQHCGEHILSYSFWKLFGVHNIGFHMSERMVTIDLDQEITQEQAVQAENFANEEIWQNKAIHVLYAPSSEAAKLAMRKKNEKIKGMVRIVAIDNGDVCTCCGTHPPYTGMIGIIKIMKMIRHRGGMRIEFLCGRWALETIRQEVQYIEEASNMLSTKEKLVCEGIRSLQEKVRMLHEDVRQQTDVIQRQEIDEIWKKGVNDGQGNVIFTVMKDPYTPKSAKMLLQKLVAVEHAVAVIVYCQENRIYYMVGSGAEVNLDCRTYLKLANTLFNGKGGGSPVLCQGSASVFSQWKQQAEKLFECIRK
ncbi:MAG: alanine--tRNA ligase-related protein [Megasphaera sp.]|jgi:alanyl-tRNA synthetase|uniref:alanyl-tRNA editing protein n=1 Tax=Megasphaera sueciensis TaxID=349094 RepID=UPI003D0031DD|nr:alanine--tRNA ligase-related protein [Megasphaera sp.]MCI1823993.1 alanine--tRNA ligase-related protein [Megasphaera sp.]